jgi:transmembrane sensor
MNAVGFQSIDEARLEQAAQWWARLQEPDRSVGQVTQWLEWLDAAPENRDAYERIQELTQRLRATAALKATQRRRRRGVGWRAAAAVLLIVTTVVFWRTDARWHSAPLSLSTPVAALEQAVLPDGSTVSLGGATSLDATFDSASRDIRLHDGEAYFEVRHEPTSRPFIVRAGDISVRAVGTAFNVRKTGGRVTVTVTEGKVQIAHVRSSILEYVTAASVDPMMLEAGQQAVYDDSPDRWRVATSNVRVQEALAWRERRLEFVDEPLDVVIANVNRYSSRHIEVRGIDLHAHSYTGTFHPETFDAWLTAIERAFPLEIQRQEDAIVIKARR